MELHCFYNNKTEMYYVCTATNYDAAFTMLETACDKLDTDTDDWVFIGTSLQLDAIQMCIHKAERQMSLGRVYEEFYPDIASSAG